jgi:hypothetical protein
VSFSRKLREVIGCLVRRGSDCPKIVYVAVPQPVSFAEETPASILSASDEICLAHGVVLVETAAKRLGVSCATIRNYVKAGKLHGRIHAHRLYVAESSLEKYEQGFLGT